MGSASQSDDGDGLLLQAAWKVIVQVEQRSCMPLIAGKVEYLLRVLEEEVSAGAGLIEIKKVESWAAFRREELRRRYFKSLFRELDGELSADQLLLDKNPVATASLHLWLRVFPESKIIIALRDPRDVVLSCFFQNLALTPLNANFLSLERAVKHYSDTMDVWLRLRELGGFSCTSATLVAVPVLGSVASR